MKGLLYYGPKDIRYSAEIPKPKIHYDDDVLILVQNCGICGTDLHEYHDEAIFFKKLSESGDLISNKKLPLTLGHEMSGIVEAVGPKVSHVKPGDHVVVEASGHCADRHRYSKENPEHYKEGLCEACEAGYVNCCKDLNFVGLGIDNGGLAEYVLYGANHVLKIPDSIPLDVAALIEPLSVSWHAIELLKNLVKGGFKPGDDALVLGAGPIGLATILCLQGQKAGRIVCSEPAKIRRDDAEKLGAIVFDPTTVKGDPTELLKKLSLNGQGFSASFDASGIPATFQTSVHALKARGIAANIAIWASTVTVPLHPMDMTSQEKYTAGSLGYTTEDFEGVINSIASGQIDVEKLKILITKKVKLNQDSVKEGFEELLAHKEKHVKILLTPADS